jgi:hypothetical protein
MNRDMALWLSMVMGMDMGTRHELADGHCEKDGKHCTFLQDDGRCRLYDRPLERGVEGHVRLNICKERNFVIGRAA